jgi:hypothetical protein
MNTNADAFGQHPDIGFANRQGLRNTNLYEGMNRITNE